MSTSTNRRRLLVGLVIVLSVAGVVLLGPVAAQDTGDNGTTTGNQTGTANGTTMGNATNVSIGATPDAAGATANHTLNVTLGDEVTGNLSYITVNYTGTNATIAGVPDSVQSATLGGQDIAANVTPSTRLGDQVMLNLSFDLNQSLQPQAGDEFAMVYEAGNPPEQGTYPIGMTIVAGDTNTTATANLTITERQATTTANQGTGPSTGNGNASIAATPDAAGATANHTLNVTLGDDVATNLSYITVNYTGTNATIAGVPDSVQSATLGGQDIAANVTPATRLGDQVMLNLSFDLNQSLQPQAGDEFAMVYEAGNPPEQGTYPIEMTIVAGDTNTTATANLTITERQATTTSMEMTTGETTIEETTTEAATTVAETTTEESTQEAGGGGGNEPAETTTSSGNGPGFTAIAALVGVLAGALLAMRRR